MPLAVPFIALVVVGACTGLLYYGFLALIGG